MLSLFPLRQDDRRDMLTVGLCGRAVRMLRCWILTLSALWLVIFSHNFPNLDVEDKMGKVMSHSKNL